MNKLRNFIDHPLMTLVLYAALLIGIAIIIWQAVFPKQPTPCPAKVGDRYLAYSVESKIGFVCSYESFSRGDI